MSKIKGGGEVMQITENENLTSHKPTYPHPHHVNHYIIVCPRATLMLNTHIIVWKCFIPYLLEPV